MKKTTFFIRVSNLLKSTEIFVRPAKKLPGKWQLFEYYIDDTEELKHIKSEHLKTEKQFFNIEFTEEEKYIQNSNLPVSLISDMGNGSWNISKNFITLINPLGFRKNVEFQFAIEKGILKLLKKNGTGKIQFFGFFKKII